MCRLGVLAASTVDRAEGAGGGVPARPLLGWGWVVVVLCCSALPALPSVYAMHVCHIRYRMDNNRQPSPKMASSILYQMHSYGIDGAEPPVPTGSLTHYEEFYTSPRKMVRIFKVKNVDADSKAHPVGSYPPALEDIMTQMKPFGSSL